MRPDPRTLDRRVGGGFSAAALAFSPDGKWLAAGGWRAVRLLDPETLRLRHVLPGPSDQVQALAFSPDSKTLAAAGGVPGVDGSVALIDTATGKPRRTLSGHAEVIYAVAWRPGTDEIATASLDRTVRRWETATGRCVQTIKDHADVALAAAYSTDGALLATGSADRTVKVFDPATGKRLATLNGHTDTIVRLAFSPKGTLATAGADKTLRLWTARKGPIDAPDKVQTEPEPLLACAFSPDGATLVWSLASRRVRVFDGAGAALRWESDAARDWPVALAFSPDGQRLAAGTLDGQVILWRLSDRRLRRATIARVGVRVEER